ncbi:hypothetical protein WN51_01414 [Melipona quadrifasciata]|uniref:Uncharacterized protein n=1 Tax=Melipona quadrifasciata TaxID=166423 RepID=A0A0M8ZXW9_9HYME|nr:hypothetical protein WN51_01414 [Melipona quadrifasciata]
MVRKPRLEIISREPDTERGNREKFEFRDSAVENQTVPGCPGCSGLLVRLISVSRGSPTSTPSVYFVLPSIGPQRAKATNSIIGEHLIQRSHFGQQSHRLDWLIKRDPSLPRF